MKHFYQSYMFNEDEEELFLILLNLGFEKYLEELCEEFTGDKEFDKDCLKTACLEVQELISKLGYSFDFSIERKEKNGL